MSEKRFGKRKAKKTVQLTKYQWVLYHQSLAYLRYLSLAAIIDKNQMPGQK